MAIFRCKMCGGDLEITEGQAVCTCEFCGTEQTLPRLDSDRKANLYDRANHFRRNNDFDKAMGIYEQILNEDNTDAEAYWSLVLCRYGIEYVEDPVTHKRIPTINRAQYTSIYADEDYKAALEHAAVAQKTVYEQEAKIIDEIQKGILAISEKEKPFDVFICYKETDESGRRTPDSVLANDLYHQLTQEGFKVFFARITLEDKLGQEYEPYIFAALNSAKVMVVLGTKPEYFKAVWVKNEWARYLALIRGGAKKMLIPAYKDMDPYDLPEEFSHLQAQDMTKLGFMQDLIRGIKKIAGANQPQTVAKETVVVQQSGALGNINALIKRGNMALEDGEWQKADDFFEEVLNQDAECAEAYWGKLLAQKRCICIDELIRYYIAEYSTNEKDWLEACDEEKDRIDNAVSQYSIRDYLGADEIMALYRYDRKYESSLARKINKRDQFIDDISTDKLFLRAKQYANEAFIKKIDMIVDKISAALNEQIQAEKEENDNTIASICSLYSVHLNNADEEVGRLYDEAFLRREHSYTAAKSSMKVARTIDEYQCVNKMFVALHGYKDSLELSQHCQSEIYRITKEKEAELERIAIKMEEERRKKKRRKNYIICLVITMIIAIIVSRWIIGSFIIPDINYKKAIEALKNGKYEIAIASFSEMEGYKDSPELLLESLYQNAISLCEKEDYEEAISIFTRLGEYKDSKNKIITAKNQKVRWLIDDGQQIVALNYLKKDYDYRETGKEFLEEIYAEAQSRLEIEDYERAFELFDALDDYKDARDKMKYVIWGLYGFATAKEGDCITFGKYSDVQNNSALEWIVLSVENDKILLLAKNSVVQKPFDKFNGDGTWENCQLNNWLNTVFYEQAFNEVDKQYIEDGDFGKIFVFSKEEYDSYCVNEEILNITTEANIRWWLRSSEKKKTIMYVDTDGKIDKKGTDQVNSFIHVRPAMWVGKPE